jgi:hypothetical protein
MKHTTPPECPLITPELIDYLDYVFPDRAPSPDQPADVIYGSVSVVRHLKMKFDEQEEATYVPT